MQAQIPATGVINLVHNPKTLFVYASTNGSALLDGNLTDVYLNVASTQPVIITNAERVRPPVPLAHPFLLLCDVWLPSGTHYIYANTWIVHVTFCHQVVVRPHTRPPSWQCKLCCTLLTD